MKLDIISSAHAFCPASCARTRTPPRTWVNTALATWATSPIQVDRGVWDLGHIPSYVACDGLPQLCGGDGSSAMQTLPDSFGPDLADVQVNRWVGCPDAREVGGVALAVEWLDLEVMGEVECPSLKLASGDHQRGDEAARAQMARDLHELVSAPLKVGRPARLTSLVSIRLQGPDAPDERRDRVDPWDVKKPFEDLLGQEFAVLLGLLNSLAMSSHRERGPEHIRRPLVRRHDARWLREPDPGKSPLRQFTSRACWGVHSSTWLLDSSSLATTRNRLVRVVRCVAARGEYAVVVFPQGFDAGEPVRQIIRKGIEARVAWIAELPDRELTQYQARFPLVADKPQQLFIHPMVEGSGPRSARTCWL